MQDKKNFLNKKSLPNVKQLFNLFFNEEELKEFIDTLSDEEIKPLNEDDGFINETAFKDMFFDLGEPNDVKSIEGTEWEATRFMWETELGPRYSISLSKVTDYEAEIIDINHQEIFFDKSFDVQLNEAIENENYLEAARLRDWNLELTKIMLDLKPDILEAMEHNDYETLDKLNKIIQDFRKTL